jgi:hypothetical protein
MSVPEPDQGPVMVSLTGSAGRVNTLLLWLVEKLQESEYRPVLELVSGPDQAGQRAAALRVDW